MDMLKNVREIGFFETGKNVVEVLHSEDVLNKVGATMPLPEETLIEDMEKIADWLNGFGKKKYMFLTPEIALIEQLAERNAKRESIILLPCDMEEEVKRRIKDNTPKQMKVHLLHEPFFPKEFYPGNGISIACGYIAGDRYMVLPETYRMIEHYEGFLGKKVFIPYTEFDEPVRYEGWIEVGDDKFSNVWRGEDNE